MTSLMMCLSASQDVFLKIQSLARPVASRNRLDDVHKHYHMCTDELQIFSAEEREGD